MVREPMTPRQREVAAILATGACNKTIARQLNLSVGTVKTHVMAVFQYLHVSTRAQAAVRLATNPVYKD